MAGDEAGSQRQGENLGLPLSVVSCFEVDWVHPSAGWKADWSQWGVHSQMRALVPMVGGMRKISVWVVLVSTQGEGWPSGECGMPFRLLGVHQTERGETRWSGGVGLQPGGVVYTVLHPRHPAMMRRRGTHVAQCGGGGLCSCRVPPPKLKLISLSFEGSFNLL